MPKISELTAGTSLGMTTTIPGVQGGVTKKFDINISDFSTTVLDDTTSNAWLTTLTATRSESGATAVPVLTKLREVLSITDFGAVGDNSTDNATAIDNAVTAAIARITAGYPTALYIPGGTYRKSTTTTLTKLVPIYGDGKTASRIIYTGSGVGLKITPPTAPGTMFTTSNDGHLLRDFSIEPLNDGDGTYGLEIQITDGQYAYSTIERIRIGKFGTSSLYLNNTADRADGIFTTDFVGCDFLNGVKGVKVGDNVHFLKSKIHGDTLSSFTMQTGARRLIFHGGSMTGSGGLDFQNCNGVEIVEPHVEIFSGTSYNGGLNGILRFLDSTEIMIQSARVAKVGTGTQPAWAIALEGTTSGVTIIDPEMASGSSGHITAASTTSDVLVISPKVDEGYSSRVITLAGARSREMGAGVVTAGDADLTIKPSDRVIVLGAALTSNRTLTLPALANLETDHEIEFIDAAGGLGTYSWIVTRASTDTIHGATSITMGTQLSRFILRRATSAVWTYGRLPVLMGGTGASTAATARTNLGVGTGDSPEFTAVNIGHASDTTITRTGAGDIAVEGNAIYRAGGTDVPVTDGGTGASDAATARTNLGLVAGGAGDIWVEKAGDSMTAALNISITTAGASALGVTSTEAGAVAGPLIQFYRNSASPAANDVLAGVQFLGKDDAGNVTSYGGFQTRLLDPVNGSEDGAFDFTAFVAGSDGIRMSVANGVTVGSPTGSFQGVGTLNATAVYDDSAILTDIPHEWAETGQIDLDRWDATVPDIEVPEQIERIPVMEEVTLMVDDLEKIDGAHVRTKKVKKVRRHKIEFEPVYDEDGNGIGAIEKQVYEDKVTPAHTVKRQHLGARLFKKLLDDGLDPRDVRSVAGYIKNHKALPGMPTEAEWKERNTKISIGELHSRNTLSTEIVMMSLASLAERVTALEAKRK